MTADHWQQLLTQSMDTAPDHAASKQAAWERFEQLGWPGREQETWRYFPLKTLINSHWHQATTTTSSNPLELSISPNLWFEQGQWQHNLGSEVSLTPWHQAVPEHRDALTWLHQALCHDGWVLRIPAGWSSTDPVRWLASAPAAHCAQHQQQTMDIGDGAHVTLLEYLHGERDPYWRHQRLTWRLGVGARVTHIRIVNESEAAQHLSDIEVYQARDSHFTQKSYLWGSALLRQALTVHLQATGAHCDLSGTLAAGGRTQAGHVIQVHHHAPRCGSEQRYQGLAWDEGEVIFDGTIDVAVGAHHTEASQINHNLLLTQGSRAKSKPRLQIHHDDVVCRHGATTGRLDEQALFYLQTRGFERPQAQQYLIDAFMQALWQDLPDLAWSQHLSQQLHTALGGRS